jgi:hypothetical protein
MSRTRVAYHYRKEKNLSLMLNYSTHGRHGEKACAAAVLGFLGLTATTTPETEREEKQKRRARGIVGAITVPAAPPMSRHGLQVENVASTTVPVRPSDGDDDHLPDVDRRVHHRPGPPWHARRRSARASGPAACCTDDTVGPSHRTGRASPSGIVVWLVGLDDAGPHMHGLRGLVCRLEMECSHSLRYCRLPVATTCMAGDNDRLICPLQILLVQF